MRAGVGLDISSRGHVVNGRTEVTGVGCSPGLAEANGVMAVKTRMMNRIWNMRLRDWTLSLRQGRRWQNFEQKKDMNLRLPELEFWHMLGVCVEWKGQGCELRVVVG